MHRTIERYWDDEQGAELVEWAVVTILLISATIPVLLMLRDAILAALASAFSAVAVDPRDEWKP